MLEPAQLIAAVVQEVSFAPDQAEAVIAQAVALGVDPLIFCMHRYAIDNITATRRMADWVGLAFSPTVPHTGGEQLETRRLDVFATVRSIREKLYDREVCYLSPGFAEAIRLKSHLADHPELRRSVCIVPEPEIRAALARLGAAQLMDEARQRLSRRWPFASAHLDLGRTARLIFLGAAGILAILAVLMPLFLGLVLLPILAIVLVAPSVFRIAATLDSVNAEPLHSPPLSDAELPIYSVLIPLRDEAHMVPLLSRAMMALSYPPEKLDIKFVVESRSQATIAAVRPLLGDRRFELVEVPDAQPRTKPKALDFALPFVRGSHLVVFDAEDIPNPDQLRLAAAAFAADPNLDCLQAELLIDNARENALTGLFAGEYASQFGIIMPALVRWLLPVPLGGSSNHFRVAALREVAGWDAFNVTEDADLGVRLARLRYRTRVTRQFKWHWPGKAGIRWDSAG